MIVCCGSRIWFPRPRTPIQYSLSLFDQPPSAALTPTRRPREEQAPIRDTWGNGYIDYQLLSYLTYQHKKEDLALAACRINKTDA